MQNFLEGEKKQKRFLNRAALVRRKQISEHVSDGVRDFSLVFRCGHVVMKG